MHLVFNVADTAKETLLLQQNTLVPWPMNLVCFPVLEKMAMFVQGRWPVMFADAEFADKKLCQMPLFGNPTVGEPSYHCISLN